MRSHHPPNLTLHLICGEVIGIFVATFCVVELDDIRTTILTIIAASIIGGFLGLLVWQLKRQFQFSKIQREERIIQLRVAARERAEANRIAQLKKPDFQTRLSRFVDSGAKLDAESPFEKDLVHSRLAFWQLGPIGQRTPPKPIEYIRRLLQHISKVIQGG